MIKPADVGELARAALVPNIRRATPLRPCDTSL